VGQIVLLPKRYVEILTPLLRNVTIIGNRDIADTIKLKLGYKAGHSGVSL
jgi:hypothetical protein